MPNMRKVEEAVKRMNKKNCKVCDDAGPDGKKTEWIYDELNKTYIRILDGKPIRAIRGKSLPDPDVIEQSRKDTLAALVKHVSAEKIEALANKAIEEGKSAEAEILTHFEHRTKCSDAVRAMWNHWQSVKTQ